MHICIHLRQIDYNFNTETIKFSYFILKLSQLILQRIYKMKIRINNLSNVTNFEQHRFLYIIKTFYVKSSDNLMI